MARVGQAVILEKLAQPKTGPERTLLLELARDYCLEVFYGQSNIVRDDEKPDLWWTQKAGLEAAGFAEKLSDWGRAIEVYRQLKEKFPPLRAALDKKILRAEENDRSQKISRNN